jgi:hypothetical protein
MKYPPDMQATHKYSLPSCFFSFIAFMCAAAADIASAVVPSPSRVHPEDRDILTPFKMVEAKKEGVADPMAWSGKPAPLRTNSRRNAV